MVTGVSGVQLGLTAKNLLFSGDFTKWLLYLDWRWIKEAILGSFFHLEMEEISISENKINLR